MTSKEELKELLYYANLNFEHENERKTEFSNKIEQMGVAENEESFKIVEKDLDLLEEYRKIEEEIGVDFITLIKILKDDVYINDGGIVDEIGRIYKEQVKSIEHWPVWGFTVGDDEMKTFYAFKDCGKTWALDKEEFYKNIK